MATPSSGFSPHSRLLTHDLVGRRDDAQPVGCFDIALGGRRKALGEGRVPLIVAWCDYRGMAGTATQVSTASLTLEAQGMFGPLMGG